MAMAATTATCTALHSAPSTSPRLFGESGAFLSTAAPQCSCGRSSSALFGAPILRAQRRRGSLHQRLPVQPYAVKSDILASQSAGDVSQVEQTTTQSPAEEATAESPQAEANSQPKGSPPSASSKEAAPKPSASTATASPPKPKVAAAGGVAKAAKAVVKSMSKTMVEDVIPRLTVFFKNEEGVSDIDIKFNDNQLEGSFVKNQVPYNFWAFFPDGKLEGSRGFSLTSHGSPPSTVEPFLVDEKKITADLLVFWITKRIYAQRLLSTN